MKKMHEKIFNSMKEFIELDEVKKVLETSEVDEPNYYLLNPQVKIMVFLNRKKEIMAKVESNGNNGFTTFEKTYALK